MARLTRRKFLIGGGLVAAGTLAFGHPALFEPYHPQLVREEFVLPRLPEEFDGFTIAHLSDFHCHDDLSHIPIQRAVDIVNRVSPDLVVLSGDFVTVSFLSDYLHDEKKSAHQAEPCAGLLSALRSRLGSVAVLGNHDVDSDPHVVTEALQAQNITVLRNDSHPVERGSKRLWFCGLDSLDARPNIDVTLKEVPKDEPAILLVHEPDFADQAVRYPVDLQLSGHSHGGQVWIPGISAPWLPDNARKYPRGRYQVGKLPLYTNIGLGTLRVPVRVNCTPEVTLVTLRAGGSKIG